MAFYDRARRSSLTGPIVVAVVLGTIFLMFGLGWVGTGDPENPQASPPASVPVPAAPPTPTAPPVVPPR